KAGDRRRQEAGPDRARNPQARPEVALRAPQAMPAKAVQRRPIGSEMRPRPTRHGGDVSAQGFHRVDALRASNGRQAGGQRDGDEGRGGGGEGERVVGADAVQHAAEEPGGGERDAGTEDEPGADDQAGAAEDQPRDVAAAGPDGAADAELVGALA